MRISFCTTCMGRAHHLEQTLPANLADAVDWSRPDAVEFVVLDYSSPDDLASWVRTDPRLQPYREAGILRFARSPGHTSFRHSHAKNMAHALATGDVLVNVDADNFVGAGFAEHLRAVFARRPGAVVAPDRLDARLNVGRHRGCMGRIALTRRTFERLGGYDESERFRGWSGEDTDLLIRAIKLFCRPVHLRDPTFLQVLPHSDAERVRHTGVEDVEAELARIAALDGSALRPVLRYLSGRVLAPPRANRGRPIGAGTALWSEAALRR
jgi:glycosyl transferase family 7 (putative galactosyltransferase)